MHQYSNVNIHIYFENKRLNENKSHRVVGDGGDDVGRLRRFGGRKSVKGSQYKLGGAGPDNDVATFGYGVANDTV